MERFENFGAIIPSLFQLEKPLLSNDNEMIAVASIPFQSLHRNA
jgi:hypothetical protein